MSKVHITFPTEVIVLSSRLFILVKKKNHHVSNMQVCMNELS